MAPELKQTPFHDIHVKLGGKMVDFAGWSMPVQYSTITLEHNAVRNKAGVFDISHMGQLFVWGPDSTRFLQHLVTNDVAKAAIGKGIYAHLLNVEGGVIDDIFVYRLEEERYLVILNASRVEADVNWMQKHADGFDVTLLEAPFAAALAVQGPASAEILGKLSEKIPGLGHHAIEEVSIREVNILVARTGYTGEDGFELFAPAGHLLQIWNDLITAGQSIGLTPCGLGARDTLRTEVAYPLYGHELDEQHTPFEAGLSWVVKLEKGQFIGRDALVKQKSTGLKQKLFGFKVVAGGVARPGAEIRINGKTTGAVASGTFSPSLGYAIGLAYLPADTVVEGTGLKVVQGTREMEAVTMKTPFYKKPAAVK